MKRILFIILFMMSCADVTSPVKNPQSNSSKEALILTYSQSLRDLDMNSQCHVIKVHPHPSCPDPSVCPSYDSIQDENMKNFVLNQVAKGSVVLFSDIQYIEFMDSSDQGGGTYQYAISKFPFVFSTTQYNFKDSARLIIDSISGSSNIYIRARDKQYIINMGDSLVLNDTVYGGNPPCLRRMIISKILKNAGLDSLPNKKYKSFF